MDREGGTLLVNTLLAAMPATQIFILNYPSVRRSLTQRTLLRRPRLARAERRYFADWQELVGFMARLVEQR